MMNSLFLKNTSKGAEERRDRGGRRDGGTVGGREEVLHSKSSRDLSLAGEGIWEKRNPDPRLSGRPGRRREGGRRRSSTLSAIMSFDEGLLASPWGRCRWACRRWAWRRTSAPDTWGRWSAVPVTAATAWQICHNTGRKMRREDQDSSITSDRTREGWGDDPQEKLI